MVALHSFLSINISTVQANIVRYSLSLFIRYLSLIYDLFIKLIPPSKSCHSLSTYLSTHLCSTFSSYRGIASERCQLTKNLSSKSLGWCCPTWSSIIIINSVTGQSISSSHSPLHTNTPICIVMCTRKTHTYTLGMLLQYLHQL